MVWTCKLKAVPTTVLITSQIVFGDGLFSDWHTFNCYEPHCLSAEITAAHESALSAASGY
jgi:hypothetical protein